MKTVSNKQTCEQFFALGSTEGRSCGYTYSEFIDIKDFRGDTHQCYCIDGDTAKLISSLPKRKVLPPWRLDFSHKSQSMYAYRNSLTVRETEHGFLVYRRFRSNGRLRYFMLTHQLTDTPVVFPSLGYGQAAAELCFPKPNAKLGCLWWTHPEI